MAKGGVVYGFSISVVLKFAQYVSDSVCDLNSYPEPQRPNQARRTLSIIIMLLEAYAKRSMN